MQATTEEVFRMALALPEDERLQLVEALLAACDESRDRPFDEAWVKEAQRRSAEIDAGTAVLTPWAEVKKRVRERLEEKRGG